MDLDTEKHGLNHTLELSELTRQQLEEEIVSLTKDKQEVIQQLNQVSFFIFEKYNFFFHNLFFPKSSQIVYRQYINGL